MILGQSALHVHDYSQRQYAKYLALGDGGFDVKIYQLGVGFVGLRFGFLLSPVNHEEKIQVSTLVSL